MQAVRVNMKYASVDSELANKTQDKGSKGFSLSGVYSNIQ